MFILLGYWDIAIDPSLVKVYAECDPQCTLNLGVAFCLASMLSQIESTAHARQLCLN